MKVSDLIESLSELDGDIEIYAYADDEGNDFNEVCEPTLSWVVKDNSTRAGVMPVHEDDLDEYSQDELTMAAFL